jgi:hypothetical protein
MFMRYRLIVCCMGPYIRIIYLYKHTLTDNKRILLDRIEWLWLMGPLFPPDFSYLSVSQGRQIFYYLIHNQ